MSCHLFLCIHYFVEYFKGGKRKYRPTLSYSPNFEIDFNLQRGKLAGRTLWGGCITEWHQRPPEPPSVTQNHTWVKIRAGICGLGQPSCAGPTLTAVLCGVLQAPCWPPLLVPLAAGEAPSCSKNSSPCFIQSPLWLPQSRSLTQPKWRTSSWLSGLFLELHLHIFFAGPVSVFGFII